MDLLYLKECPYYIVTVANYFQFMGEQTWISPRNTSSCVDGRA